MQPRQQRECLAYVSIAAGCVFRFALPHRRREVEQFPAAWVPGFACHNGNLKCSRPAWYRSLVSGHTTCKGGFFCVPSAVCFRIRGVSVAGRLSIGPQNHGSLSICNCPATTCAGNAECSNPCAKKQGKSLLFAGVISLERVC